MSYPVYSYPFRLLLELTTDILRPRPRSFRRDGLACLARLQPPLRILGAEHVPTQGPCLITFNHYYRRGFNAWWMALALAAVVPLEIHFGMTSELTFPGKWYARPGQAGSRWLLRRLAMIYGFTGMPPMPPREQEVFRRANAVRAMLSVAQAHPQAVLGLAPEGGDPPGGVLSWPASGVGRFLLLLAEQEFPLLPVGIYEEQGEFCLHFGVPYALSTPPGLSPQEKDHAAAARVMAAIAQNLPDHLRGNFK